MKCFTCENYNEIDDGKRGNCYEIVTSNNTDQHENYIKFEVKKDFGCCIWKETKRLPNND